MTTLDVTLSAGFLGEVGTPGTGLSVYAIAYDTTDTTGTFTTLVNNGVVDGDGTTVPVALPSPFESGKVYFVIQDPASTTLSIQNEITQQSILNTGSAAADHFAYDSVELNLQNGQYDVANLTSVVGFTLPMEINVPYVNAGGTVVDSASVGYGESGNDIISNLTTNEGNPTADIAHFLTGSLAADFPTALSPSAVISAADPNPSGVTFQSTNWQSYVNAVGSLLGTTDIQLSGAFVGAKDADGTYHNSGYFAYDVSYDATATLNVGGSVETGVFELVPTANSEIKGVIGISATQLEDSIYSTLGTAEIFDNTSEIASGVAATETINTGVNNQWGAVLRTFLVGFTAGYYGGSGTSPNPQISSRIDLDNNINWDPSYAFRGTTSDPVTNPITAPAGQVVDDPYSQVFYANSNSYGSGYSDALMSTYSSGHPQVSVYDPATGLDVPTIDLTLFADGETPAGYTVPTMHNYIAPPSGGYDLPNTVNADNITLNFMSPNADNAGMALNSLDAVTLEMLTSDTANDPQWVAVTLDGSAAPGGIGLWNNWTVAPTGTNADGVITGYSASPGTSADAAGSMVITGIPVVGSGTATEWTRIVVGGKTFNLYTTTQNGTFDNPLYAGQAGSIAIDGLGVITPASLTTPTVATFAVDLATGSGVALNPTDLVVTPAVTATATPDAPVAGLMNNGTFESLPGQVNPVSNTITAAATASDLSVAFGWTGLNSLNPTPTTLDPSVIPWTNVYTNKVGALDTAEVTITPVGDVAAAQTVSATAGLDGTWETGTVDLGAGSTYDITMNSYQAGVTSDAGAPLALTPQSQELVLDITCFVAGTRILTARGEVAVENLIAGDRLPAKGAGLAAIKWIGRRHVECRSHPNPRDVAPVRVVRSAFAPNVPHRDLLLSPDHAVLADGVLIPVRYLVNGRTVRREMAEIVTYYHVELAHHDVILAEGLACESYLDTGNRATFDNALGTKAGDDYALGVWARDSCAPLVLKGESLARVRRHLLARAEELGHAMTRDPALRVVVDGRVLRPQRTGRLARFRLPAAARDVRLVSRSGVPAQTAAGAEDHRQLGVGISAIKVDGQAVALDDSRLGRGWHRLEHGDRGEAWRWTDGDASLALTGGQLLEVQVALTEAYWQEP